MIDNEIHPKIHHPIVCISFMLTEYDSSKEDSLNSNGHAKSKVLDEFEFFNCIFWVDI